MNARCYLSLLVALVALAKAMANAVSIGCACTGNISSLEGGAVHCLYQATTLAITYQVQTGEDLANLQSLSLTGADIDFIDTSWEQVTVADPVVTAKRFGRLGVTTGPYPIAQCLL